MGADGLVTVSLYLRGGRRREHPRVSSHGVFEASERARVVRRLSEHVRNRLKGQRFRDAEDAEDAAIAAARRFLVHNHRRRPLIKADASGES